MFSDKKPYRHTIINKGWQRGECANGRRRYPQQAIYGLWIKL